MTPKTNLDEELPVVVLDISSLKKNPNDITPTDKLREIIEALIKKGVRRIAIDVDFSPRVDIQESDDTVLRDKDDEKFFEYLLKLKKEREVSVFLGVYNVGVEPDTWLGAEEYKNLAAYMTLMDDTSKVPAWLQCEGHPKLNSISKTLAENFNSSPKLPIWITNFLETYGEIITQTEQYNLKDAVVPCQRASTLVNYKILERLRDKKITLSNGDDILIDAENLRDKLVIIGYAQEEKVSTSFNVQGHSRPVLGVFIHAIATYTLVADPFYKFKFWAEILIIFLLIGILIFGLLLIRQIGDSRRITNKSLYLFEGIFIAIFIIFTVVFGGMILRYYNILWSDFKWLWLVFVFLHSGVGNSISSFRKKSLK